MLYFNYSNCSNNNNMNFFDKPFEKGKLYIYIEKEVIAKSLKMASNRKRYFDKAGKVGFIDMAGDLRKATFIDGFRDSEGAITRKYIKNMIRMNIGSQTFSSDIEKLGRKLFDIPNPDVCFGSKFFKQVSILSETIKRSTDVTKLQKDFDLIYSGCFNNFNIFKFQSFELFPVVSRIFKYVIVCLEKHCKKFVSNKRSKHYGRFHNLFTDLEDKTSLLEEHFVYFLYGFWYSQNIDSSDSNCVSILIYNFVTSVIHQICNKSFFDYGQAQLTVFINSLSESITLDGASTFFSFSKEKGVKAGIVPDSYKYNRFMTILSVKGISFNSINFDNSIVDRAFRFTPFSDWLDIGKGFLIQETFCISKMFQDYTPTKSTYVTSKFCPTSRHLKIVNHYQGQQFFISEKNLDAISEGADIFIQNKFCWSNLGKVEAPIFGFGINVMDWYGVFLTRASEEKVLISSNDILTFIFFFKTQNDKYISNKKTFIFLKSCASKGFGLYFKYGLDFRGRDSFKGTYNPINSLLCRYVFYIQPSDKRRVSFLSAEGLLFLSVQLYGSIYLKRFSYSIVIKNIYKGLPATFELFLSWLKPKPGRLIITQKAYLDYLRVTTRDVSQFVVSIDASASAFQILSVVCHSKSKLKLLNLTIDETYYDFYQCVLSLPAPRVSRERLKRFCMLKIYGASFDNISKEFVSDFGKTQSEAYAEIRLFHKHFIECFKNELGFLNHLYKKYKVSDDNNTIKYDLGLFSTEYFYHKKSTVRHCFYDHFSETNRSFSMSYPQPGCHSRKHVSSFRANLIHSLDALVRQKVYSRCIEADIPCFAVHDCFIVHPNFSMTVLGFYNLELIELSKLFISDLQEYYDINSSMKDVFFNESDLHGIRNSVYSLSPYLFLCFLLL